MLAASPQVGDRVLWQGQPWTLARRLPRGRWQVIRGKVRGIVLQGQLEWCASWRGWLIEDGPDEG